MRNRLIRNRRTALLISLAAGVLAAVLLIVYLQSYRSSVNSGTRPERVLVATQLIPRGTSAATIATKHLYAVTTVQKDQLQPLAISDPSSITGNIAAADIFPGQQLTTADFTAESANSLNYQITGPQRAIAIPVDTIHGLLGEIGAGDFVDVYVSIAGSATTTTAAVPITATQVRLLAADVMVLSTGSGSSTILRVDTAQVAKFAYVADNEHYWLILRPQVGASHTPPSVATLGSLLQGGG